MMKKLLSALLILISINCFSQTTGYLRYDTVKIMKQNGNSNLIIENATRGLTNAFLQNYSEGRTKFAYALDSVWIDGDSVRFRYGGTTLAVLASSPEGSELPTELISPGQVVYSGTGLKFYITPAIYRIDGIIYQTTYDSVTLSAADPANPRKDVIYLATTGVEVATGTPAGPAAEPQIDGDQIKLTVIDVPAAATTPGITIETIYDENTEWTVTNTGTTTDPNQASIVFRLTKALNVTNINSGDIIHFTNGSTVNVQQYDAISGFIKLKAVMSSAANLRLRFFNGATVISTEVTIAINKNSTDWQAFSVPITSFTFSGNTFADRVNIRYTNTVGTVHTGFYLDYLYFEQGLIQPGSGEQLTMGPIDGATASPDGGTIANNKFHQQTASQTYPGLMSATDKTKLDSLHSDYYIQNLGNGEDLATQPNDSTVGIKSLKAGTNVTLTVTDTTITINGTGVDATKIGADFSITNDSLKRANSVNVKDYGAVGDGVTNNSTAFQNAINTGKPVFVPSGTFLLSTRVDLKPNQTIFGDDWSSIIKITANTSAIKIDTGSRITGLHFIGNGKAGSGNFNSGVWLNDAVGWSVDNCMFESFSGDLALNGGGGIFGSSIGTSNSDGGRITNNYFYNNDVGLNLGTRAEYVTVTANTFGANNTAIHSAGGNHTIVGNIIQNNTNGIKTITTTNPGHSIISNNLINHNIIPLWFDGIASMGVSYLVSNNMIYYGGIKVVNSTGLKFTNNHFSNLDSIHLDNSKDLYMQGGWLGLSSSGVEIPIRQYNSAENFDYLGVAKEGTDSIGNFFNQYLKSTVALSDSVQAAGRFFLKGNRPASASSTDSVLVWNTTSKEVLVRAQSDISGGGGGTPTLQQVLDAGSTLISNENIATGAFSLGVSTSTSGSTALSVSSDDAAALISISNSGIGIQGTSTSNYGGSFQSSTGIGSYHQVMPSSTNTVVPILKVQRLTSGTAANNIGGSIDFGNQNTTGNANVSNQLISKWVDATTVTRESEFDISGVDNATTETFMNIQKDLVRINNNADTLATKAYARSVGGGGGGGGTVTSVDMTVPAFLSVSGNPITTSGTLAVTLSGTALPVANGGTGSTTQNFVDLSTTQTVAGVKTFSSIPVLSAGLQTFSTAAQSNLNVPTSRSPSGVTEGSLLLEGSTNTAVRVSIYGSSGVVMAANQASASLNIGANPITEATSGTHPLIANLAVKAATVTNGTGATANLAGVYIEGPPTGVTATTSTSALWAKLGNILVTNGNLTLGTAGNKINVATGSNASIGTATLVAGTVTVNTTAVVTGSKIFVTVNTPGGTQGFLSVPDASITTGTSFVINSTSATETSTVNWWIIN